jgi:prepilin signal peptidase PulO-like enzyme (type II secretory pathway)
MPVQRVRRVIRKIDPWTVLKVSIVFNAIMALVTVLGLVVFWSVFVNAGIPDRINDLALTIGLENGITFDGAVYFRIAVLLAIVGTILMTGLFTLGAVIYNLISDLVGGVEFVVLEETGAAVPASRRVKLPVTVAPVEGGKGRGVRSLPKVAPLAPPTLPGDGEATRVPEPTATTRLTGGTTRQTGT